MSEATLLKSTMLATGKAAAGAAWATKPSFAAADLRRKAWNVMTMRGSCYHCIMQK
jgi:hypothetical protein